MSVNGERKNDGGREDHLDDELFVPRDDCLTTYIDVFWTFLNLAGYSQSKQTVVR